MDKKSVFGALFRTILILTILALAINPAFATSLKSAVIEDRLKDDLSMDERINITLADNSESEFILTLPDNSQNISVNGQKYPSSNSSLKIPLSCKECQISISYSLYNIIRKDGAQHSFYRTVNFPKTPETQTYTIYIPPGHSINLLDQTTPSIVPKPTSISSDGENTIITWKENKPLLPSQYLVVYYNAEESESFSYILKNDLGHPTVIIVCVLLFLAGFAAGFFVKRIDAKKRLKEILSTKTKNYAIPSSLLSPDEQMIVDLLDRKDSKKNPVNQKEIGKELNWSKSKVSAVLSNLHYKKLIEREKFGRNYKVKLVKEIHKH